MSCSANTAKAACANTHVYRLPQADRMERLVNNEYLADAFFLVGEAGQLMFAHRNVLTMASEVFDAQFNGHFQEAQQHGKNHPVHVADIEPSTFEDILRFMYCEKIDLAKVDLVDVYYAAKKYMLASLEAICEKFFRDGINEENVLKIFNDNRRHEFDVVNKKCLAVVLDNPLKCFKHEDFFTLEKRSLQMIAKSPGLNCQEKHLTEAVQNWLQINQPTLKDGTSLTTFIPKREAWKMTCRKLRSFDTMCYAANVLTDLTITVEEPLFLYGLGIFVGTQTTGGWFISSTMKLSIDVEHKGCTQSQTLSATVGSDLHIQEVMFEKLTIDKASPCRITAKLESVSHMNMFCLKSFTPVSTLSGVKLKVIHSSEADGQSRLQSGYTNCVAHLLYDVEKAQLDGTSPFMKMGSIFNGIKSIKRSIDK